MGQPNPVAVLDKAVAILSAVSEAPATLTELVARTGIPRATAHRLAGRPGEAAIRYRRAVALAGTLAARSERLLDRELAADLLERAGNLTLSDGQRLAVARVLEALGRYADAEDALFELIDEDPDDPEPVEEAIAFCQRLRPLEPERLAAGGLPLAEVTATLAELLRRPASGAEV